MSHQTVLPVPQSLTIARVLLPALCLFLSTGCSTFHRDWHHAACYDACARGLEGRWEGTWCSHVNGHHGKLCAIITKQDDGCYYAQYHATYLAVIPFGFEMPMSVTENAGVYNFEGQADLGWLAGGTFSYAGAANECEFESGYCAKKDHGVFSMRRVTQACCD